MLAFSERHDAIVPPPAPKPIDSILAYNRGATMEGSRRARHGSSRQRAGAARLIRRPGARARAQAFAVALAVLATGLLAAAPTALGLITKVSGRLLSYQAIPGAPASVSPAVTPAVETQLKYHGGPVMTSNTNYALYWDPAGAPAYPPDTSPG